MPVNEQVQPWNTLVPSSRAAGSANGVAQDLWAVGRAREVMFILAAPAGNTGSATVVMEESDDNTTFTTIANADTVEGSALPVVTTAAVFATRTVRPQKRYVRARHTVVTGPQVFGVVAIAASALEEGI